MNNIITEDKGFFQLKDSSCVEDAEEMHGTIQLKDIEKYIFFKTKTGNIDQQKNDINFKNELY